jgi:hypothetical protein
MQNLPKPSNREEALKLINQIQTEREQNRAREMHLNARLMTMKGQPVIGKDDLGPNLLKILPPHIAPKNLGQFNNVMWDYFYPVAFDFGTDPVYGPQSRAENNFKVNQDGSFLLFGISRTYSSTSASGKSAPLVMTLRDMQSTRQFNDTSFPIQNIGEKGQPLVLETPLLIFKNSNLSCELSSWLPENMSTTGSGKHEFLFFGLRVRDEEQVKLLQTIFA